jgi:hypothetical protein
VVRDGMQVRASRNVAGRAGRRVEDLEQLLDAGHDLVGIGGCTGH